MKERHFYIGFFLLFVCFFAGTSRADDVDLIFLNGNIYTVSEKQPHAEAIGVKKDRIVFVGSNADAKKWRLHKRALSISKAPRSFPA